MAQALRQRRRELERTWRACVLDGRPDAQGRPEVLSSWKRSAAAIAPTVGAAPVSPPEDVAERWAESRLGRASRIILDDLNDLARDGDIMAAITDETVTIAWAAGGRTMARRADRVHFMPGGCWGETAVGTNALSLACSTARPATVFSAEHFAPIVHDWVCYSAPVIDPVSGRFLGVVDLSTLWDRAHPVLLTTVSALARCVEHELTASIDVRSRRRAEPAMTTDVLELVTLGAPALLLGGRHVPVTRRQLELLTVLSLHPDGLTLDELTGRVYGDHRISPSTVKAELSHLRHLVGGRIGSRPYRLLGPVVADHRGLLDALAAGDLAGAVALYGGQLLPLSDSPEIETWRHQIDAAVREAALTAGQPDLLYLLAGRCGDDVVLQEAAYRALEPGDSRRSIAAGRLAAANRSV